MKKQTTDDPNRATLSALSRLVQADRKTIRAHLAHDGAPQRGQDGCYDRNAAVKFLRAGIGKGAASLSLLEQLRTRRLELEIEKTGFELSIQKKEYIKLSTIWPQIERLMLELHADLYRRLESELPPRLVGKGQVEISLTLRDCLDEAFAKFRAGGQRISPAATVIGGKGGSS